MVAKRSMYIAIVENKEGLAGLIVGDAKNGLDYFDRFVAPGEQKELF